MKQRHKCKQVTICWSVDGTASCGTTLGVHLTCPWHFKVFLEGSFLGRQEILCIIYDFSWLMPSFFYCVLKSIEVLNHVQLHYLFSAIIQCVLKTLFRFLYVCYFSEVILTFHVKQIVIHLLTTGFDAVINWLYRFSTVFYAEMIKMWLPLFQSVLYLLGLITHLFGQSWVSGIQFLQHCPLSG